MVSAPTVTAPALASEPATSLSSRYRNGFHTSLQQHSKHTADRTRVRQRCQSRCAMRASAPSTTLPPESSGPTIGTMPMSRPLPFRPFHSAAGPSSGVCARGLGWNSPLDSSLWAALAPAETLGHAQWHHVFPVRADSPCCVADALLHLLHQLKHRVDPRRPRPVPLRKLVEPK